MATAKAMLDLWLWPWTMAQTGMKTFEVITGAPQVIGARLPTIQAAMFSPLTADHKELTRMVSEKTRAFSQSGRAATQASRKMKAAVEGNARDFGKLAGGSYLGPADLFAMTQRNVDAMLALSALPAEMIAPVHRKVSANRRRLVK